MYNFCVIRCTVIVAVVTLIVLWCVDVFSVGV